MLWKENEEIKNALNVQDATIQKIIGKCSDINFDVKKSCNKATRNCHQTYVDGGGKRI